MNKLLISLFTILILSISIFAQQTGFEIVKTDDGMIVVHNNKTQRFSFFVSGKNPKSQFSDAEGVYLVTDSPALIGGGLSVFCVNKSEFPKEININGDAEVLSFYRQFNVNNMEETLKTKLKVNIDSNGFVNIADLNNKPKKIPTFYWGFMIPSDEKPLRNLTQAVVIGDRVLVIGGVFPETTKLEQAQEFFKQTFESISLLPQKVPTPKKIVKPKSKKKTK